MDTLKEYNDLKKKYKDFVEQNGKKLIKLKLDKIKQILEEEKFDIENFRWEQYTPYFNDGDPCVFGVHDLQCKISGDDDSGDYEDGYNAVYYLGYDENFKPLPLASKLKSISFCDGDDDIFLQVFGDHVQVTYNPKTEKFNVDEYEHD